MRCVWLAMLFQLLCLLTIHFLVRPRTPVAGGRRRARLSEPAKGKGQNAAIDASVRELAGVSRLGIVKKTRNK